MYRRSADIEGIIDDLAADFPDLVTKIPLTPSLRRRLPISALRIRAGDLEARPGVLFVGGAHARELLNPDLLVDLVLDLLSHYLDRSDWVMGGQRWPADTLRAVVESLDIFVLPNANPDGRERVLDVNRLWRKNRRDNPGICDGVDVNRNFDLLWGIVTRDPSGAATTSRGACADTFVGPGGFSEPETANVRRLLDDHAVECFVDVHSFSELILHPWGHAPNQTTDPTQRFTLVDTSDWQELPRDAPRYREFIAGDDLARFVEVGDAAAEAIRNVRGRTYAVQQGTELYPTTGTSSDYAFSRHVTDPARRKVYGFTFETGPEAATVEDSFQPPDPEAGRIAEEATSGLISVLASFAPAAPAT